MSELVEFIGTPDGPEVFRPEFGCTVKTFSEPGDNTLPWHVPLHCRGYFKPAELDNWNFEKKYRTDEFGYMLCYRKFKDGTRCPKRAINRAARCGLHGGRLHPLDKIVFNDSESNSRYRQFLRNQITIEDLDDEEISKHGFRRSNGKIYSPKKLPHEVSQAFAKAVYNRATQEMRKYTVDAARTVAEIMMDETNDATIRFKAAEFLIERNLGKTPQVVAITNQAPWEEIFNELATTTREESRARRVQSERLAIESTERIDNIEARKNNKRRDFIEADELPSEPVDLDNPIPSNQSRTDSNSNPRKSKTSNFDRSNINPRAFERSEAILNPVIERPRPKGLPPDGHED